MDLSKFQAKPHRTKSIFRKNKIKLVVISQFLDIGYNYASSILNGHIKPTPEIDQKLQELADAVQKQGAEK